MFNVYSPYNGTYTVTITIIKYNHMKLIKLFDGIYLQCYYIQHASNAFKKKHYYKPFITIFRDGDAIIMEDTDKINPSIVYKKLPGYIFSFRKDIDLKRLGFSTETKIPAIVTDTHHPIMTNLDRLFAKGKEVAMALVHNHRSPLGMIVDALDLGYSLDDIKTNTIEKEIVEGYIEFTLSNVKKAEDWLNFIIKFAPLTRVQTVPSFAQEITDESFREENLRKEFNLKSLALTYDMHAHDNAEEYAIAHKMDVLMIDPQWTITINNDYGNLAKRIKEQMAKEHITPKDATKKNSITITFEQDCSLKGMNYTILDCI